jgi:outer membrane protein OmpA-like peptidoglycan-associated protein
MTTRFLLLATVLASLAACASLPDRNSALEQARGRFNSASADPQVARLAPEELKNASESLRVADTSWREGASPGKVDHLAYMTVQRVTIAQDTANSRAAQAVTTGAAAERDKTRLTQRTNEADKAQQQLAVSEQSNAQKSAELAARAEGRDARVRDLELQLQQLNAKKTDRGMVVTLGDVLFDSGQSKLLADGSRNMAKLADFFKRNPRNTASIEGYTDSVGGRSANLDLSDRRAHAVMAALVDLGVAADHLSIKAHGEDMPAASNDTAAGRQMNRRVEIVFAAPADEVSMR